LQTLEANLKAFFGQLFLIVIYGGIVQGIFIVLLLNNNAVRKGRANLFLSILLLALSFSTAHILFAGAVLDHISAEIYSIGDPTFYLIAPLLWFYTLELTGVRIQWRWSLLLHFLLFFLIIIFSLSFRSVNSASFVSFLDSHQRLITILFWITVVVQFSWYLLLVHRQWTAYQRVIQQEVSSTENVSIEWVRFFMIVFMVINVLFLFSLFAAIHLQDGSWLPKATALVFSLSIFALGYKGILQKEVLQKGEIKDSKILQSATAKEKPDPTKLDQLRAYMDEKKPYLDPE